MAATETQSLPQVRGRAAAAGGGQHLHPALLSGREQRRPVLPDCSLHWQEARV